MYEVLYQNSLITLKTLNILLALGFLFAGIFCIRYCERHNFNLAFLSQSLIFLLLSALVFGRLFYGIEHYELIKQAPMILLYIWDLNMSFFGVLFGLFGALYILAKKHKEDFWTWLDVSTLSVLAVLIFVHLGYFFSGKHYGIPTELPWGIAFDAPHIPYINPLHPIELYATLMCILLLAYSVGRSKRIHLSGVVGTRALMIYSVCMFGLDFLRGDPELTLYNKIAYGLLATLSLIATVHCSHKTHMK